MNIQLFVLIIVAIVATIFAIYFWHLYSKKSDLDDTSAGSLIVENSQNTPQILVYEVSEEVKESIEIYDDEVIVTQEATVISRSTEG